MQLSNLSLAFLLEEIRPFLEGSIVRKVQELDGHSGFKLKLQTRQGTKDLILSEKVFFISEHALPVEEKPARFAQRLKKFALNKKILSVSQNGFERIVEIQLEGIKITLELFGKGNIFLVDNKGVIAEVLKPSLTAERPISKGHAYVFPKAQGVSPLELSSEKLFGIFSGSGKTAFDSFLSGVNVSMEACTEIFFQSKISLQVKSSDISNEQAKSLSENAKKLYIVSQQKYSPVESNGTVFPFAFESMPNAEKIVSINGFLSDLFSAELEAKLSKESGKVENVAKKKLEAHQSEQLKAKERLTLLADDSAKKAELIYQNFEELQNILSIANQLEKQGKTENEILSALRSGFADGLAKKILSIDIRKKEIAIDL